MNRKQRIRTLAAGVTISIASVGLGAAASAAPAASPASSTTPSHTASAREVEAMRSSENVQTRRNAQALPTPVARGLGGGGTEGSRRPEQKVAGTLQTDLGSTAALASTTVVGGTSTANAPKWPLSYSSNPNRQLGKLFFYDPGTRSTSWCSATAVTSGNKSTVLTAGHCVYKPDPDNNGVIDGNGYWFTNFQFCPGYEYGCKLGIWNYRRASTTNTWYYGYGTARTYDFRDDVAVVLVNRDSSGRYLTDAVGSQGIWFNGPQNVWRTAIGYPKSDARWPQYSYDGEDAIYCQNVDSIDAKYTGTMWIPCTMTGGASGGPWLTWVDSTSWTGYVNSVDSHKPWGGGYMNGPYFGAAEQDLYNTWQSQ